MYIDTHLHLSLEYYQDIEKVILDAQDQNVKYFIVSCCNKSDILEGITLLEKYDCVFLSIGFHPSEIERYQDSDILWLESLIQRYKKIVAIGEIGLDYHYGKEEETIKRQQNLFKMQLDLAQKLNLPVVIHTRDAVEDTILTLKNYSLRGVIHCFTGSLEVAREYIRLGYYLGIGGVLTFKNSKLSSTISTLPLDRLLLETDSPYLSPEPLRGRSNEPSNIPIIAQKLADVMKKSITEIADITTDNACSLFDLNP